MTKIENPRRLIVVLGDQLDPDASWTRVARKERDLVWMAEASDESTHVWSHRQRIALFLSAMRHFRDRLRAAGWEVAYQSLEQTLPKRSLFSLLEDFLRKTACRKVWMVQPGEYRVLEGIGRVVKKSGAELEILGDDHFFCSPRRFSEHAKGRKSLRMEFFYREMRKEHGVLMNGSQPEGGQWNFDAENRKSFGKSGPGKLPDPRRFHPDATTREVLNLVGDHFAKHPGDLDTFAWPVTPEEAKEALADFIDHRLPRFGDYQDAMWTDEPFLHHSLISSSLNLKLLDPRTVVAAAQKAYREGKAPLPAVEGFIRQILGWREYVRGIYWQTMPGYLKRNALGAKEDLPGFYWTGETEMACLRHTIRQTLKHGYAHHIQRLMVTGLYSLLLGVRPQEVHAWYLAVYVDAVEWVELPNTLGMSQYGDGGLMASKPYVATGKYIDRMSNYCRECRFDPAKAVGDDSCPFTTLYWDFLLRHQDDLASNQRMALQLRNLKRLDEPRRKAIRAKARKLRSQT